MASPFEKILENKFDKDAREEYTKVLEIDKSNPERYFKIIDNIHSIFRQESFEDKLNELYAMEDFDTYILLFIPNFPHKQKTMNMEVYNFLTKRIEEKKYFASISRVDLEYELEFHGETIYFEWKLFGYDVLELNLMEIMEKQDLKDFAKFAIEQEDLGFVKDIIKYTNTIVAKEDNYKEKPPYEHGDWNSCWGKYHCGFYEFVKSKEYTKLIKYVRELDPTVKVEKIICCI